MGLSWREKREIKKMKKDPLLGEMYSNLFAIGKLMDGTEEVAYKKLKLDNRKIGSPMPIMPETKVKAFGQFNNNRIAVGDVEKAFLDSEAMVGKQMECILEVDYLETFDSECSINGFYRFPPRFPDVEYKSLLTKGRVVVKCGSRDLNYSEGDYVHVLGKIERTHKYNVKNIFGEHGSALVLQGVALEEASVFDAYPADRTIITELNDSEYGCSMFVEKVDFMDNETRIYMTIINNRDEIVEIYPQQGMVTQRVCGKEQEIECGYGNYLYPGFPDCLEPGQSARGVVTIEGVNESEFFYSFSIDTPSMDEPIILAVCVYQYLFEM